MNRVVQSTERTSSAGTRPVDPLMRVRMAMLALAGDPKHDAGATMIYDHLSTGGKLLRARLALSTCAALGGSAFDAIDWAVAVELLHNASLIHDDIQDGDRLRRGKPSLWARYGTAQAINAGDLLLMLPFRALRAYPAGLQATLVQILAEHAETTVRGQIHELAVRHDPKDAWSDYVAVASGKTGTLFALPVRGAAQIAGVPPDRADRIAAAFASIGVLYQLQDDLLDPFDIKGRGAIASDIAEGRLSALILAHLELHPHERESVLQFLATPREDKCPDELGRLRARLQHGGAARELLSRIDARARALFMSESLAGMPEVRRIADDLVRQVLAPLRDLRPSPRRTTQGMNHT